MATEEARHHRPCRRCVCSRSSGATATTKGGAAAASFSTPIAASPPLTSSKSSSLSHRASSPRHTTRLGRVVPPATGLFAEAEWPTASPIVETTLLAVEALAAVLELWARRRRCRPAASSTVATSDLVHTEPAHGRAEPAAGRPPRRSGPRHRRSWGRRRGWPSSRRRQRWTSRAGRG